MSFPQPPFFSPLRKLPSIFNGLVNANYGDTGISTFARLINRNYGAISASTGLNAKVLAYWAFEEFVNREYSSGNFANYIVDEVGDPNLSRALRLGYDGLDAPLFSAGLVGNTGEQLEDYGVEGIIQTYYAPSNPVFVDPVANTFDFVGIAFWIKLPDINARYLDPNSSYFLPADDDNLEGHETIGIFTSSAIFNINGAYWKIITRDPVDPVNEDYTPTVYDLYMVFDLRLGNTTIESNISSPEQWNLVTMEIDKALGTASIRINLEAKQTISYTPTYNNPNATPIRTFSINYQGIHRIDEAFVYSESLTGLDVAAIYNSGAGRTYPLP